MRYRIECDVETENWEKHKDVDVLPNFKFPVSNFTAKIQDRQSVNYF